MEIDLLRSRVRFAKDGDSVKMRTEKRIIASGGIFGSFQLTAPGTQIARIVFYIAITNSISAYCDPYETLVKN